VPTFISYSGTLTFSVYSAAITDKGTFTLKITAVSGLNTATLTFDLIVSADGWNYHAPTLVTKFVD
jgi:lysine/ornithine N-monooxygenase